VYSGEGINSLSAAEKEENEAAVAKLPFHKCYGSHQNKTGFET